MPSLAPAQKIIHPPLLRAAADAVSLKWNLLSCLFLDLAAGDLLQKKSLRKERDPQAQSVRGSPRGGGNGSEKGRKPLGGNGRANCVHLFAYPPAYWAVDVLLLGSMGVLEALRLYLGAKGNLTEEETLLGSSLLLTVANAFLSLYFLLWATFVLWIDVLLNGALLTLYGLEGLLQAVTIAAFVS
ncbi:transmembrane protein 80 isoform X2 [Antechinus flavipes]|uniref:transmembrane protein 80 isoform X2 n=1 Tax=Antechinus flavipes TaxID=38775 RepID=UPI0022368666|nr:transmembrane protein 80 isoform X2 [Antechinus flavipes]